MAQGVDESQASGLTAAVKELTRVVQSLDKRLMEDYPKRSEIERRFTSKLETRKRVAVTAIVALITVTGCYITSIGAYATCFTGNDNPSGCKYVPGYDERIERRDEINQQDKELRLRIERLERQVQALRGAA